MIKMVKLNGKNMNEQELSTFQQSLIEIEVLMDNKGISNLFSSIDLDEFRGKFLSTVGEIL